MRGSAELGVTASAAVGNALRLVAIGDQGRDVLARFDRIAIGERLPAVLRSRTADGNFQVELAGTSLRMSLPAGMQIGQRIELTLVAREPRPTFLLQRDDASVKAEVSPAGRLIDTLLRPERAGGRGGASAVPPAPARALVDAARPVADAPLMQSEPLARALANALSTSGLFYESHVAQWVNGSRSQAQLQQEPQFGWTARNLARPEGAGAAANASANTAAGPAASPAVTAAANAALMSAAVENTGPSATQSAPPLLMDPASEAAQMLRLQLETLEHSQVLWRGEAWPGLPMEWGVADDGGSQADPAERNWQSVLRFHFDKLGTVAATINLSGGQVQLALRTEDDAVSQRLRGAAGSLADALQAAGTPLHVMTVRREETP